METGRDIAKEHSHNPICINCGHSTAYVCLDFGSFICSSCAGIHRELGHRVKSVNLAKFTDPELAFIASNGNKRVNATFFGLQPPSSSAFLKFDDHDSLRTHIENVYIRKIWFKEPPEAPSQPINPPVYQQAVVPQALPAQQHVPLQQVPIQQVQHQSGLQLPPSLSQPFHVEHSKPPPKVEPDYRHMNELESELSHIHIQPSHQNAPQPQQNRLLAEQTKPEMVAYQQYLQMKQQSQMNEPQPQPKPVARQPESLFQPFEPQTGYLPPQSHPQSQYQLPSQPPKQTNPFHEPLSLSQPPNYQPHQARYPPTQPTTRGSPQPVHIHQPPTQPQHYAPNPPIQPIVFQPRDVPKNTRGPAVLYPQPQGMAPYQIIGTQPYPGPGQRGQLPPRGGPVPVHATSMPPLVNLQPYNPSGAPQRGGPVFHPAQTMRGTPPPQTGTIIMTQNGPALVVPGQAGMQVRGTLPPHTPIQTVINPLQYAQPAQPPVHTQQQPYLLSDEMLARRLQEEENRLAGL